MGIFFDRSDPKISKDEFKRVAGHLHADGLSDSDIDDVKKIFRGDVKESGSQSGISRKEMEAGIQWMKKNRDKHSLSDDQIKKLEGSMKKYL